MKILVVGSVAMFASCAFAETLTWIGGADGRWSATSSWTSSGLHVTPQPGDDVVIRATDEDVSVHIDAKDVSINTIAFFGPKSVSLYGCGYEVTGTNTTETAAENTPPYFVADANVTNHTPVTFWAGGSIVATNILVFVHPVDIKGEGPFYIMNLPDPKNGGNRNTIYFQNPVTAPGISLVDLYGCVRTFNSPVRFRSPGDCKANSAIHTTLGSPNNEFPEMYINYWSKCTADVHHAFPTNLVMRWKNYVNKDAKETTGKHAYIFSVDQIIDRIESDFDATKGYYYSSGNVQGSSSTASTLELRATADATTYSRLLNKIDLKYNAQGDYVQSFVDRIHPMTGSISVLNGTVRNVGTNTFSNVESVFVDGTGRFEADLDGRAPAASPFNPLPKLRALAVMPGGKVKLSAGVKLSCGGVATNGVLLAAATYTAADLPDVLEGEGSIVVTAMPANTSVWTGAKGTATWADADNWFGGVPTAASTVWFLGGAATLATTDAFPAALTLIGAATVSVEGDRGVIGASTVTVGPDATLELGTGAKMFIEKGTWNVDGGTFLVDGGYLSVSNTAASIHVGGDGRHTGRISVTAGRFSYHISDWSNSRRLNLAKHGEVLVSNVGEWCPVGEKNYPILYNGGRLILKDNAQRIGCAYLDSVSYGNVTVQDHAVWNTRTGSNDGFSITPANGADVRVVFRDDASFAGEKGFDNFVIAGSAGARATLEVDITNGVDFTKSLGNRTVIGGITSSAIAPGYGELILRNGKISAGYRGTGIGAANGSKWANAIAASGGSGKLRVEGGTASLGTQGDINTSECFQTGVVVGDGGLTLAKDALFRGEIEQTGGSISQNGNMYIGGARGEGVVNQSGGSFATGWDSARSMFIGFCGGHGSFNLSGGTNVLRRPVFIGGANTNRIVNISALGTYYPYPFDTHGAVGEFAVSGSANLEMSDAVGMTLGEDGHGTFSVTGSAIEKIALRGHLTLLNSNVPGRACSSTLKYTFDENGIYAPYGLQAVTNTPGTKVVVDFGTCANPRGTYPLLKFASWEGPDPELVIEGKDPGNVSLVRTEKQLAVKVRKGLIFVVR